MSLVDFVNGAWLKQEKPALADSIESLDWTKDGLTTIESEAIQDLLYVAVVSIPAASTIVSWDWVLDGIIEVEAQALRWMNNVNGDEVIFAIVSLDWVQDRIDSLEVEAIEQLSYVAFNDTDVAGSVVSLDWVQDGIHDTELAFIDHLAGVTKANTAAASKVVSLDWVLDGIVEVEAQALRWMNNVNGDEVIFAIVSLDWVQDRIDSLEVEAIEQLSYVAFNDTDVAGSVVSLDWVQDGIHGTELAFIDHLAGVTKANTAAASKVVSLDWVLDGIVEVEAQALRWMNNVNGDEVIFTIVSLDWVQDRIDSLEVEAIEQLSYVAFNDTDVAGSVVSLDWVQDGIHDTELAFIDHLAGVTKANTAAASKVVSLDWVLDGIVEVEAQALRWMNNVNGDEVIFTIVSLDWVQDRIDSLEVEAIEQLSYVAFNDTNVAGSVVSLDWVQDGIEGWEIRVIRDIAQIVKNDAEAAWRIVRMPFLQIVEPRDALAMTALSQLASFEPTGFRHLLAHPMLAPGITDNLTPVIATIRGVWKTNPALIDILLDPATTSIERRTITLPLAGVVELVILRTREGAARSMDLLEASVRAAEDYLNIEFPTRVVVLLYEYAVTGSDAGTNFGTHIAIRPKFDIDDGGSDAAFSPHNIAHEVSHYYWNGNADWLDEGASDFTASLIESKRTGAKIGVTNSPCAHAASLAELEKLGPSRGDRGFICNYSLGERLFVDLYQVLGDDRFRQGLRELYRVSTHADVVPSKTAIGIEQVREAFQSIDKVSGDVVARWYDGSVPYDLSAVPLDEADAELPYINGRIEDAYVALNKDGPPVSSFSTTDVGDWVWLILKYTYRVSQPELPVTLEIVEYFEDGFEFKRRPMEITARQGYIGGTASTSIGRGPSREWATGRYWVHVYDTGRKVAEVEFVVTP